MEIKPDAQSILPELSIQERNTIPNDGKPFIDTLKDSISKVNQLQQTASASVTDLAAGKDESLHQAMIAVEKADVSFQLMMQVRNKILSAYEEISRMQI